MCTCWWNIDETSVSNHLTPCNNSQDGRMCYSYVSSQVMAYRHCTKTRFKFDKARKGFRDPRYSFSVDQIAMYVQRNIKARSRNHSCRGKPVSINYSECMPVNLVIQHAKRMRRIVLSSVACLAVPYFFFFISHKGHDFREKSYWT